MEDTQEGIAPDFGIVRGKNLPYIPSYCLFFFIYFILYIVSLCPDS